MILLTVESIQCQFNFGFDNLVNKTKVLQEIERFGEKVVDNVGNKTTEIKNDVKDAINQFFGSNNGSDEETIKLFINETMKTMAKGICVKEVP